MRRSKSIGKTILQPCSKVIRFILGILAISWYVLLVMWDEIREG